MVHDDTLYHRQRAEAERQAAANARTPEVAFAHRQLAELHEILIKDAEERAAARPGHRLFLAA